MTISAAVRLKCLACLSAKTAGSAFDCLSSACPLYACCPFRGRLMPKGQRGEDYDEAEQTAKIKAHHKKFPKRRPSKAIINAMCRDCQPETTAFCTSKDCPLRKWTPFQRGGQPKRATSPEQKERLRARIAKTIAEGKLKPNHRTRAAKRPDGRQGTLDEL